MGLDVREQAVLDPSGGGKKISLWKGEKTEKGVKGGKIFAFFSIVLKKKVSFDRMQKNGKKGVFYWFARENLNFWPRLAAREGKTLHINILQKCGHFLAIRAREGIPSLLPLYTNIQC